MIQLKRAYDPPSPSDGYRVLVDRLWPRGLKKEKAHLDAWLKDIAPSTQLRQWFAHDPTRFDAFRDRYERELTEDTARARLDELAARAAHETVTLVYSAHDEEHNNAVVLAREIERRTPRIKRTRRSSRARAKAH